MWVGSDRRVHNLWATQLGSALLFTAEVVALDKIPSASLQQSWISVLNPENITWKSLTQPCALLLSDLHCLIKAMVDFYFQSRAGHRSYSYTWVKSTFDLKEFSPWLQRNEAQNCTQKAISKQGAIKFCGVTQAWGFGMMPLSLLENLVLEEWPEKAERAKKAPGPGLEHLLFVKTGVEMDFSNNLCSSNWAFSIYVHQNQQVNSEMVRA